MHRLVRPKVLRDPTAHSPDGVQIVSIGGHHQVDDLHPDTHLAQDFQGAQDGREFAGVELFVSLFIKALQIHVRGVHILVKVSRGALFDGATGYDDVPQFLFADGLAAILRIFEIGCRFRIGV